MDGGGDTAPAKRADRASQVRVLDAGDFQGLATADPELHAELLRNLLRRAYEIVDACSRELASVVSA